MPTANDTRVRGRRLVEDDGDRPRPGQRLPGEPVGLHRVGQVEHLDLLVGRQVVVAQEVPGSRASSSVGVAAATLAASRTPGRAARNASACVVGEDQRRRQPDDVRRDAR